jgi:glycosyltransferase involved in cell wall biosynthesis
MKIAMVSPLVESVPPLGYGGTERVVSYLTEALVSLGHDVTLFASGDSRTAAHLVPIVERALRLDPRHPDQIAQHTIMIDRVFEAATEFDVLHSHLDFLHFPLASRVSTPCVTTQHGRLDLQDYPALFERFAGQALVSISDAQRAPLPTANWRATVHHGLPRDLYAFHARADAYLAFVGRISREKRLDRAIDIALACRLPLRIAAKVDPADRPYFDSLAPLLDHRLVQFLGEIGEEEKQDLIGRARALLFPIDWPEPFGIVMIEALACGTPVIAYSHGSVPEVIDHGVTGYIVDNQQQAFEAAHALDRIDRARCRQAFERRFTAETMAHRYLDVYRELAAAGPPGA